MMPIMTESTRESAMGSTAMTTTSEVDHGRIVIDEFTKRSIVPYENGGMPRHYFWRIRFRLVTKIPIFRALVPKNLLCMVKLPRIDVIIILAPNDPSPPLLSDADDDCTIGLPLRFLPCSYLLASLSITGNGKMSP